MKIIILLFTIFFSVSVRSEAQNWTTIHQGYAKQYAAEVTSYSNCGMGAGDFAGGPGNCFYYNYMINAMAYAVEASGDSTEMAQLATAAQNMVNYATKTPQGHLVWPPWDAGTGFPVQQLGQIKGAEALAKVAAVINNNATFKAAHGTVATNIINFLDDTIYNLWTVEAYGGLALDVEADLSGTGCPVSGVGPGCYQSDKGSMFTTTYIHLYQATKNNPTAHTANYLALARRGATGFKRHLAIQSSAPNGNQGAQSGWLVWDPCSSAGSNSTGTPQRCFGTDSSNTIEVWDISHGTDMLRMMVAAYEAQIQSLDSAGPVFTLTDMQQMAKTFDSVVWDGSTSTPRFSNYINGSNAQYSIFAAWENGIIYHGWALLGRYSAKSITAAGSMMNALITGSNASPSFPANFGVPAFGRVGLSGTLAWAASGAASGAPLITILTPTIQPTYVTNSNTVTFTGTATGVGQPLGTVTWSNDRGGSGVCTGTTSWSCVVSPLEEDVRNLITFTANEVGGQTTNAFVTIAYSLPAMVGAWSFDENSGSAPQDASGNGNHGTFGAGVAYETTNKKFGDSALAFTGGKVTIPDSNSLDIIGGWSFTGWIYPTTVSTTWQAVMAKDDPIGGWPVYHFYATVAGQCGDGSVEAGNSSALLCYSQPLPVDHYTHVGFTYDGENFKLYLDGALVQTTAATGLPTVSLGSLTFGDDRYGEPFTGYADEFRLYNKAIPQNNGAGDLCTDLTVSAASIVRDKLCGIEVVSVGQPAGIKLPASATALKVGAGASIKTGVSP